MREAPPTVPDMLDVRSELSDNENHVDVTVASGRLEALSISLLGRIDFLRISC